jgi:hypothetical protein
MSVSKSGRGFGHVSADEHQSEQWSMQLVRHRMKPRGAGIVQSTAGALLVVVQGRLRTLRRNTRNVWVCASQRDALGVQILGNEKLFQDSPWRWTEKAALITLDFDVPLELGQ